MPASKKNPSSTPLSSAISPKNVKINNKADYSSQYETRARENLGRPLRYLLDTSRQYIGETQTQRDIRLQHECEMAKNKELALQRLRTQELRSWSPHLASEARGREERRLGQENIRNVCVNRGDYECINMAYDNNVHNLEANGRAVDCFIDSQKETTFRQLNFPTSKQQQRTRSCPSPGQSDTLHSSAQRFQREFSRPTQHLYCSPTRSVSVSPTRSSLPITTAKCPVSPVRRPVYRADCDRSLTKTATTTTTTRGIPSQHIPICPDARNSYSGSYEPDDHMNISNMPPNGLTQYSLKTPRSPVNVTNKYNNKTFHEKRVNTGTTSPQANSSKRTLTGGQDNTVMATSESHSNKTSTIPLPPPLPLADSNSKTCKELNCAQHNDSMIYELSHHRRPLAKSAEKSYIDLTDETQYRCEDMDLSVQELSSTYPIYLRDSERIYYSGISPEDFTYEPPVTKQTSARTVTGVADTITDGTGYYSTLYRELPSSFKVHPIRSPQDCLPSDQPKSTLFRCLAKKLSSTFNIITAMMSPQKSTDEISQPINQPTGQIIDNTDDSVYIKKISPTNGCDHIQLETANKGEDPHRTAERAYVFHSLVTDGYCPGIIQETIDGVENFNYYSFNISKDIRSSEGPFAKEPITLLEAFAIRIDKEREEVMKNVKDYATMEQIEDVIQQYFATQNPSDLNRSIKGLLISEYLKDHEIVEKSKGISFEAEVQKLTPTLPNNQVKLIAYTGHTKLLKN